MLSIYDKKKKKTKDNNKNLVSLFVSLYFAKDRDLMWFMWSATIIKLHDSQIT